MTNHTLTLSRFLVHQGPGTKACGLKVELGSRRKAGFSTYPQAPLSWKRPWYTSISGPGVWKFRATTGRTHTQDVGRLTQGP